MNNKIEHITFLGTGTSTGIPVPGCSCHVCTSPNPKDKRYRCSLLLRTMDNRNILIDTTPDLRTQMLTTKTNKLDAVVITHHHADHINGIDDVRPFCFRRNQDLPLYCSQKTGKELERTFPYIFKRNEVFRPDRPIIGGGIPMIAKQHIPESGRAQILGVDFQFFDIPHGHTSTSCFSTGRLAYFPDSHRISRETINQLNSQKLEYLIIDCVQKEPHQTHLHFDLAVQYSEEIAAKKTFLIHMGHKLSHDWMCQNLEKRKLFNIVPAHDFLELAVSSS